jgi:hypothetical protein
VVVDFVHVDTVFPKRIHALIIVEHGSSRVHLTEVTANPTGAWTVQATRNLTMDLGQRIATLTFMVRNRDSRQPIDDLASTNYTVALRDRPGDRERPMGWTELATAQR